MNDDNSAQYSKHPTFHAFITSAIEAIRLLELYGFQLHSYGDAKNECHVRFANPTTGLEFRFDMPKHPTASVARLKKGGRFSRDHYGLRYLVEERCPGSDIAKIAGMSSSADGFRTLLDAYCKLLDEQAKDVLAGDFSVFPALKKRADAEFKRLKSTME